MGQGGPPFSGTTATSTQTAHTSSSSRPATASFGRSKGLTTGGAASNPEGGGEGAAISRGMEVRGQRAVRGLDLRGQRAVRGMEVREQRAVSGMEVRALRSVN